MQKFRSKEEARQTVWDQLQENRVARFPFPPHGRIPNFAGAAEAAARLFELPVMRRVKRMKVNPDSPQRYVRELALRHGITVVVPTPRLRGGFKELDPAKIAKKALGAAASLSRGAKWAKEVPLARMRPVDLIVVGSVAVTRRGHRCGKGEGYADIEYAVLRELGQRPVPVATTVHPLQIVESFPVERHDLAVDLIITPEEVIRVRNARKPRRGIAWDRLSDEDLEQMPILRELKQRS